MSNLQSYRLEPKPSKKSFDAIIVSASVNLPDNVIVFSFPLFSNSSFILFKAVSQSTTFSLFSFFMYTLSNLCLDKPSIANLVLSLIHSSFVSSLMRGKTLKTCFPRVSTLILEPTPSSTSCVSVLVNSHGLDLKA